MRLEVKRLPAGKSGATRPIELAPILRKSRGGVRVRVIKVRVRVRVRVPPPARGYTLVHLGEPRGPL